VPDISAPIVHVLQTRIDPLDERFIRAADERISAAERERAHSYRRPEDRCRFLAGRMLVRIALRHHAGMREQDAALMQFDSHGRPAISGAPDFNISHSGSIVACAVARGCRIGIDVERIRPLDPAAFLDSFASDEWRQIRNASPESAPLLRFWTRKESVLKADGRGMGVPLLEVRIRGDEALLDGKRWFLWDLDLGAGHVGTVAADRSDADVRARQVTTHLLLGGSDPQV
jgi:4'-phosphopantetheinyl transferase